MELLVHNKIRSIRGKGLLLAAQFESFDENKLIIDRLIEKGIVTDWFLFSSNYLRIAPPLIINDEQTREVCKIIIETLDEIF